MPNFEWISETLVRLGEKLGVDQQGEGYYIEFDHNRDYVGSQYLEPLLKYIINKTPIKIDYKPFKYPNNVQWIIHPYFLKQYNGRWFLLGWKEDAGDGSPKGMMTLGLERICAMPIPASVEYIPTDVDFSAYFEDVIGVSIYKDSIMINLKLKFSEKRYPYVVTKPIYPYQKTNDEERTLQMLIIPNHELDTLILSFGRDVEVLSPMEYRDHIKSILSDALDKYSKCEE